MKLLVKRRITPGPVATMICLMQFMGAVVLAQDNTGSARQQVPPPNDRQFVNIERNVRVATAVPSADETEEIFGSNLYRRNIQPVWLQIENLGETTLMFLPGNLHRCEWLCGVSTRHISHRWRLPGRTARPG